MKRARIDDAAVAAIFYLVLMLQKQTPETLVDRANTHADSDSLNMSLAPFVPGNTLMGVFNVHFYPGDAAACRESFRQEEPKILVRYCRAQCSRRVRSPTPIDHRQLADLRPA
jgi:hypothetical protein